jgi:hypothetical protein
VYQLGKNRVALRAFLSTYNLQRCLNTVLLKTGQTGNQQKCTKKSIKTGWFSGVNNDPQRYPTTIEFQGKCVWRNQEEI